MKRLILGLVFAILVAIFALQNNRPFAIRFLFWRFPRISEALVIIASVLLGVMLGAILAWRERMKRQNQNLGQTGEAPHPSGSIDDPP